MSEYVHLCGSYFLLLAQASQQYPTGHAVSWQIRSVQVVLRRKEGRRCCSLLLKEYTQELEERFSCQTDNEAAFLRVDRRAIKIDIRKLWVSQDYYKIQKKRHICCLNSVITIFSSALTETIEQIRKSGVLSLISMGV